MIKKKISTNFEISVSQEKDYRDQIRGREESVFMVEEISKNAIWQENVFAITDKEPVILKLEKDSPMADGVHIFDVYHTY